MEKMRYFKTASIAIEDGAIIVNTVYTGRHSKHKHVTVRQEGDEYVVSGYQSKFDYFEQQGDINDLSESGREKLELYVEEAIETVSPWNWFFPRKTYRRLSSCYSERKEGVKRKYTGNNLIIIE